jgi:hypothetical protein
VEKIFIGLCVVILDNLKPLGIELLYTRMLATIHQHAIKPEAFMCQFYTAAPGNQSPDSAHLI